MNLTFSDRAIREIDEIAARLDREHPGYGERFTDELALILENIKAMPERYPRVEDAKGGTIYREAYLSIFEYRVIYTLIDTDEVEIRAFVHARTKPGRWM